MGSEDIKATYINLLKLSLTYRSPGGLVRLQILVVWVWGEGKLRFCILSKITGRGTRTILSTRKNCFVAWK